MYKICIDCGISNASGQQKASNCFWGSQKVTWISKHKGLLRKGQVCSSSPYACNVSNEPIRDVEAG